MSRHFWHTALPVRASPMRVRSSWRHGRLGLSGGRLARASVVLLSLAGCGGDAVSSGGTASDRAPVVPSPVRGVVVVSIDTLRADRLGLYGDERGTSPNLDSLGQRSVVFDAAHAQAAQTAPSHASLLTSLQVGAHGISNVNDEDTEWPVLPSGARTLAEQLAAAGVSTGAFVSNGNLTRRMGVDRGFSVWDERNEDVRLRIDALLGWLQGVGDGRFFALLHSYQVHAPYVPPAELARKFTNPSYTGALRATYERYLALPPDEAWRRGVGPDYWPPDMVSYSDADVRYLSDLYDAEISYTDAELRRLFEVLLTGPRKDDTAIIVLSDHGEEFRDHGKFMHDQIYEELIRVPLVIFGGAALERRGWKGHVATPVQLVDVAPTICALMGLPAETERWSGRSMIPLLSPETRSEAQREERPVFSEFSREHGSHVYRSVSWHGWKYIEHRQPDAGKTWEQLFDLAADPREEHSLADSREEPAPANLAHLRALLDDLALRNAAMSLKVGRAGATPLSAEDQERLKSLGYTGEKEKGG